MKFYFQLYMIRRSWSNPQHARPDEQLILAAVSFGSASDPDSAKEYGQSKEIVW